MRRALVVLVLIAGCVDGPPDGARVRYNQGVALLAEGKLDEAVTALAEARTAERGDPELRYGIAFNLGVAYAKQGEAAAADGPQKDATKAVDRYRRAAESFNYAKKVKKKDADAQANLERVQARILALIDEANRGENGLEKRLEQLIGGERGLRDEARALWTAQDARTSADPLADKDTFDGAATRQRILGAEAGVVADLAGDEITAIGGKAEAQRSDEEKGRLVQLQNLDLYLQDARKEMLDARRNLSEMQAELAYRRTEGALVALKRAREQLLDPVTVLRGVAQEHLELMDLTAKVAAMRGTVKLGEAPPEIPAWMEPVALSGQQLELHARVEEVRARLAAVASSSGQPAADAKPEEARTRQQVAGALPAIVDAAAAMRRASEGLRDGRLAEGTTAQREALEAMAKAIEQFLTLRGLIDLALAEQKPVVAALGPEASGLTAADRMRIVGGGARQNHDRVARMQQMIADELARATAAGPDGQAPTDEQKQQAQALYGQAETVRGEALAALAALRTVGEGGQGPPALESAQTAQQKLVELQRLFFSVPEHLKQLIHDQGETADRTAEAIAMDDLARTPALPPLVQREREHQQMGDAIAQAIAAQADAAAQQPQQPPNPNLQEAAGEVRNAVVSMQDAAETLGKAADPSATMSFDLSPVHESQKTAIEHLENALRLLQPPKQQQDQNQQNQQNQQPSDPQDEGQQGQPDKNQTKEDAERRLQQVREREAQRQRERKERQRMAPEPVDKDW